LTASECRVLHRGSRISAGTDAARRRGRCDRIPESSLLGPAAETSFRIPYCGGLTPSLVICTRVAVILPPASVVTAMTAY